MAKLKTYTINDVQTLLDNVQAENFPTKQSKILDNPITVNTVSYTTVEQVLGALNDMLEGNQSKLGTLSNLNTESKATLVGAINELFTNKANKPSVTSTLSTLADNVTYNITVTSEDLTEGAFTLPQIPQDTSNGIIIYLNAQTAFALAFPTGYTPHWYGEIPDTDFESGKTYCLTILDNICSIIEIV